MDIKTSNGYVGLDDQPPVFEHAAEAIFLRACARERSACARERSACASSVRYPRRGSQRALIRRMAARACVRAVEAMARLMLAPGLWEGNLPCARRW
jgi:hypothetical protein